jgi:hypothetical protein
VTFEASRRQAARRSSSSASLSSEEEEDARSILGRVEVRVARVGREGFSFFGSAAGFEDEDFLEGAAGFGSGFGSGALLEKRPPEGAAAFGVGGVFGLDDFFDSRSLSLDLCDFFSDLSDLSDFDDFSDFSAFDGLSDFDGFSGFEDVGELGFEGAAALKAAAALDELVVFAGVGVVLVFAGGDVLVVRCANGLGHAPTGFGVSSTFAAASFFACAAAFEPFTGVFGSGVDFAAAAAFGGGAPLLPVATGGAGGPSAGNAFSPKSCRARSFTLGNMVYEKPGYGYSGRLVLADIQSVGYAIDIKKYYKYNRRRVTGLWGKEEMKTMRKRWRQYWGPRDGIRIISVPSCATMTRIGQHAHMRSQPNSAEMS